MRSFVRSAIAVSSAWMGFITAHSAAPVITEIHYQPVGTNVLEEWFELLNPGPAPLDLSGWKVTRGLTFSFPPGISIPAQGHLVVASHSPTFQTLHPDVLNFVGGWSGTLSDDGETLELTDATGTNIVRVNYSNEGDWGTRRLGAPDQYGKSGWEWFSLHAGGGSSLELVNESLPGQHGQNWTASNQPGGTPGRFNSTRTNDAAPLILEPRHFPPVPRSDQTVTVSTRILDDLTTGFTALVHWRSQAALPFQSLPLLDDGNHGDGLAGDGLFAARLPAHPSGTLIEFYLTATDAAGHSRTVPHVEPTAEKRSPWFVYQVDDSINESAQPLYRIVASAEERAYLESQVWLGSQLSDARVNGTFITIDGLLSDEGSPQVRYFAGFRNRGHGTRYSWPHNFRVDLAKDRPWRQRTALNLNSQSTAIQNLGSAVFRALGVPIAESTRVQLRWNGVNLASTNPPQWGAYAANEPVDSALAARQVPQDPDGNLYQAVRGFNTAITPNLAWHGNDPAGYTNAYFKQNHSLANEWSDLVHLINTLNNTSATNYTTAVRATVDVPEWMRYFAIHTFLDNQETSLGTGVGDDYILYFPLLSRRAQVWAYDMDSLLGAGTKTVATTSGLFRAANVPAIARLIKHPEFAPEYHRQLRALSEGFFDPARFDAFLDGWSLQLQGTPALDLLLQNLKAYNASRVGFLRSQLPSRLSITNLPPLSGSLARSTSATTLLGGSTDASRTTSILVNGSRATYSPWEGTWSHPSVTLHPGLNRIVIQALDSTATEIERQTVTVWFDNSSNTARSDTLSGSETWSAANGPYLVGSSLTIPRDVLLRIEPGTSVYLTAGANLTVADGGRLLAEGTPEAPLWIGRPPNSPGTWGGIVVNGSATSPETRITHAHIEGNGTTAIHSSGGTVFLDHLSFGSTDEQYVSLDDSSFVVSHCHFPPPSATLEPLHGTGGIKAGGHGILLNCYIGSPRGYSDSFDFSGGNRPGQPILHILGNVFAGSGDDGLDLDGTDAWVEGNLFIGIHRNGAPDSAAAISGGSGGGATSEITVINNLFFDNDNAATSKQGNFYTLLNNTIVRTTREGGLDFASGIVNLRDTTPDLTPYGRGTYLEGNVITDAESLIRNPLESIPSTFINNLLPFPWTGPGSGNRVLDAALQHIPTVAEARFNTWQEAQVMWQWFRPTPDSPAIGTGIQGRNLGGVQPVGVIVSGEPFGTNASSSATLIVGPHRSGNGIPTDGFPAGSGYIAYRWRLDGSSWSPEIPINSPIQLVDLAPGPHSVEVSGKRDSGLYQDDPLFGVAARSTHSRTWVVDPLFVAPPAPLSLRLNEVLASNSSTLTNAGTTPDLVELLNTGTTPIELGGISLSDSSASPRKFTFPSGASLAAGTMLVLIADAQTNAPGIHLGFSLKASGDNLLLTDAPSRGSTVLDQVTFGLQLADLSIGRGKSGNWQLGSPSLGSPNGPVRLGDPRQLRINEWLASARFTSRNDFVELYNAADLPVALDGLRLSDSTTQPDRFRIPPLSFIGAHGHARFIADGDPGQGPDHLTFKLSSEYGLLHLSDTTGRTLDVVAYGPQRTDASQGRSPDGADRMVEFGTPTPSGPNAGTRLTRCTEAVESISILSMGVSWAYQQTDILDGVPWLSPGFDDSAWPVGPGPLGVEDCNCLPAPGLRTNLRIGRNTYYFRTRFVVETNLSGFKVNLTTLVDDGAIITLNGVIIAHPGMATNGVAYATRSTRNQDNASLEYFPLPDGVLIPGTNFLTAEVHQTSSTSKDIVWGASLEAARTYTNCTPVDSTPVVLNEVFARNLSRTNTSGQIYDWVELHNPSTNAASLAGLSLTDDPTAPRRWVFPPETFIPARGFLTIACDPLLLPGPGIAPIALDAAGGTVFLFDSPAHGGSLIDSIRYGVQATDFAIGRFPDGADAWQLTLPTESSSNVAAALGNPAALRINEWMADPATGSDWFELFNSDPLPVAIAGLFLTDSLDSPFASPIPPLSFLGTGSGAYRQFFADGQPSIGANHVDFNLRRAGEVIGAFAATGQLLDAIAFGAQATGISQGRFPDGAPTLRTFAGTATPGTANSIVTTADADGDGMLDSWERAHGLDPADPTDAAKDTDGDGNSNLREFLSGTDPRDDNDVLALSVSAEPEFTLQFRVVAGRTYTVEFQEDLSPVGWTRLVDLPNQPAAALIHVPILPDTDRRLYRIVTPARP